MTWGTPTLSSWLSRYKGVEEMMSHPPVNSYSHSIIIVFAIYSTVHNCHLSLYLILKNIHVFVFTETTWEHIFIPSMATSSVPILIRSLRNVAGFDIIRELNFKGQQRQGLAIHRSGQEFP